MLRPRHERRGLTHGRARTVQSRRCGNGQHAGTAAGIGSVVMPGVRRTAERHRGTLHVGARMPRSIGAALMEH